jgi:hypothetical protein
MRVTHFRVFKYFSISFLHKYEFLNSYDFMLIQTNLFQAPIHLYYLAKLALNVDIKQTELKSCGEQ